MLMTVMLTTLATGCYKNTMVTGAPMGQSHTSTVQFYLWGLAGQGTFDLDKLCPGGVAKIEEQMTAPQGLANACTCGLFMPMTVTITCANGSAYHVDPDGEMGLTWIEPLDGAPTNHLETL